LISEYEEVETSLNLVPVGTLVFARLPYFYCDASTAFGAATALSRMSLLCDTLFEAIF